MGLETGTYISDLNSSNPVTGDNVSQGDDHIKLIKSTLQATFPNLTGAVTPTHTELNYVDGVTSSIQTQLDAKIPFNISSGGATTLSALRFQIYVATSAVTVTLPASPSNGDMVLLISKSGNVQVARNGNDINGSTSNVTQQSLQAHIYVYESNTTASWWQL